jgi:hypothetical protein
MPHGDLATAISPASIAVYDLGPFPWDDLFAYHAENRILQSGLQAGLT